MKTRILAVADMGCMACAAMAQNQYDALRFLGSDLNGTARFVGMGGAMSALGADLSTIATNPAGIGLYRSNDAAVSFGWNSNSIKSDWNGTNVTQNSDKMSFDQIGFVWTTKIGNKTDLRYLNFAFNYHKKANFTREFNAKGALNNGLSITDQMADMLWNAGNDMGPTFLTESDFNDLLDSQNPYLANKYIGTPFLGTMGARTGLVDPVCDPETGEITDMYGWQGQDGEYYSREEGSISEYDFNMSFNVRDRFYFGVTLGVYDLNYTRYSSYGENLEQGAALTLDNWAKTEGTGFDLKLGAIIRPFEYSPFRIGFAIHTPTWYAMTDKYVSTLTSYNIPDYDGKPQTYTENLRDYYGEPNYLLDYHLISPWKFNVSAGTTFSGIVALDAEYEYDMYQKSRLTDTEGYDYNGTTAIDETLKGVHTFRVGMEACVTPRFSVRAGYNFQSSPITDDSFKNIAATDETRTDPEYFNLKSTQAVTVGLGYRGRIIYADLAYKYAFYKGDFYAFDADYTANGGYALSPAKIDGNRNQILLTVGVRF